MGTCFWSQKTGKWAVERENFSGNPPRKKKKTMSMCLLIKAIENGNGIINKESRKGHMIEAMMKFL